LIRPDEFKRKALEQGINERVIDLYLEQRQPRQTFNTQPSGNVPLADEFYNNPNLYTPAPGFSENAPTKFTSARGVKVTQPFGNYNPALYRGINPSMTNTGVDLALPEGSPVLLPQGNWQVEDIAGGYNRGYGNSIMVRNTQTGETLRFSHLSKMTNIKRNQQISGNRVIGLTGRTGHTTGAHLDLEYRNPQGQFADALRSPYGRNF